MRKKALKYSVFGADEAIEGDAVTLYILRRFRLVSNRFCTVVQNALGHLRVALVAIFLRPNEGGRRHREDWGVAARGSASRTSGPDALRHWILSVVKGTHKLTGF